MIILRERERPETADHVIKVKTMHINLLPFTFIFPVQISLVEGCQRPLFESMVAAGSPSPAKIITKAISTYTSTWYPIPTMSSLCGQVRTEW